MTAAQAAFASGNPDTFCGGEMYISPKLERYGTFREITLGGGTVGIDTFGDITEGCTEDPATGYFICAP
jgi:hypothetical protein